MAEKILTSKKSVTISQFVEKNCQIFKKLFWGVVVWVGGQNLPHFNTLCFSFEANFQQFSTIVFAF
jgi:hypothetical protein